MLKAFGVRHADTEALRGVVTKKQFPDGTFDMEGACMAQCPQPIAFIQRHAQLFHRDTRKRQSDAEEEFRTYFIFHAAGPDPDGQVVVPYTYNAMVHYIVAATYQHNVDTEPLYINCSIGTVWHDVDAGRSDDFKVPVV